MLAGNEILPVGHPNRIIQQAEVFFCQLFGGTAIGIHYPDIIAPTGIRSEQDLAPVRAEPGLYFPGQATAQELRLAT